MKVSFKGIRPIVTFNTRSDVPVQQGTSTWVPVGYAEQIFGSAGQCMRDFLEIPELNAIINIRARAMASGIIDAYSKESKKPQSNNQSLVKILRRPNWFQGVREFWRQSSLWRDIYGNEYIYFLTPTGRPNSFMGMFTLNPGHVKIEYKDNDLFFLDPTGENIKYTYKAGTTRVPLNREDLVHLNDNRVTTKNIVEGISKIDSLQAPLANIRAAYYKRNIALNMPIGVMSNGATDDIGQAVPMDVDEKAHTLKALKNRGALPIMTNLIVKYDKMEIDSSKMGLFEECREDTGRICDAFGVPYEILASQKGVTFANLKEAKKQFYEETIKPDVNEKINSINNFLGTESLSWEIQAHFDHLAVFSEDKKQFAISLKQLVEALSKALADGAITKEQYQAALVAYGLPKNSTS